MWKRLGRADLEQILSEDETQKLAELSRPDGSDPVQEVIDLVADLFRGALGAKGHELDVRAHYIPPEYAYAVLVYSRWSLWTRFPMSPSYANDEARKSEYEFAQKLLQNPWLDSSKPDYSDDPELSASTKPSSAAASIFLQPLRFPPWWVGDSVLSLSSSAIPGWLK